MATPLAETAAADGDEDGDIRALIVDDLATVPARRTAGRLRGGVDEALFSLQFKDFA